MNSLVYNTETRSCPVCSKNLEVIKTRALVLHEDKTYCSRNCLGLDGTVDGRLKSFGGRTKRAQQRKYTYRSAV
jgi:hypothetical protein